MSTWAQRAKAHLAAQGSETPPPAFPQKPTEAPARTDETPLLSVLAAPSPAVAENCPPLAELLAHAERACIQWGDGQAAKEQMRADCRAVPAEQRAGLIAHFASAYGAPERQGRRGGVH